MALHLAQAIGLKEPTNAPISGFDDSLLANLRLVVNRSLVVFLQSGQPDEDHQHGPQDPAEQHLRELASAEEPGRRKCWDLSANGQDDDEGGPHFSLSPSIRFSTRKNPQSSS